MFNSVVTNKGRVLQNKQVDGATITFTRIVTSTTIIPVVNLREQTALTNIKQTLTVQAITLNNEEQTYTIQVLLENTKLTAAYNLSQVGFYATDPDEGEILFALAQLDTVKRIETPSAMPGYTLEMNFKFSNSNEANITMEFDPEGLVTRETVEALDEEVRAGAEIAGTETGNRITVTDSTDAPFNNLTVHGMSEQYTTTGAQLMDFNGGTASTGMTKTFENDVLTIEGDGSLVYQVWQKDITGVITGNPGKVLYFDYEKISIKNTPNGAVVQLNIAYNDGTYLYKSLYAATGERFSYTAPSDVSNIKSVHFAIYTSNNASTALANKVTITKPMFQIGLGKIEYEKFTGRKPAPNPDYPQEVVGTGNDGNLQIKTYHKNFISPKKITLGSNTSFDVLEDGYVITATGSVGYANTKCWLPTALAGHKIIVKYDSAEWTNMGTSNVTAQLIYKTGGVSKYLPFAKTTATELKVTLPDDATDMYVAIYTNNANSGLTTPATITIKGLMVCLDLGDDADYSWCKYQETLADIALDVPLYGIPLSRGGNYIDKNGQHWICDEIDLARGVYIQRIKKVTIDSTYTWHIEHHSSYTPYWTALHEAKRYEPRYGRILCTKYIDAEEAYYNLSDMHCSLYTPHNLTDNAGKNWLYIRNDSFADASEVNAYFAENTMDVYFELAEPVETALTEEQIVVLESLRTFDDITSIFVTADIGNLSVNYFKNTNNGKASAIMASKIVSLHSILGEMSSLLDEIIGGA